MMSLQARIIGTVILAALLIAGWWRLTAYYDNRGYQRAVQEADVATRAQQERNRELQRAAEKRYVVQTEVREQFIVETIKEVRYVTRNLASCQLEPDAVRLLNAAAACAREDRPASCGAHDQVPDARPAR